MVLVGLRISVSKPWNGRTDLQDDKDVWGLISLTIVIGGINGCFAFENSVLGKMLLSMIELESELL